MIPERVEKQIIQFGQQFNCIEKIILFGSRAVGDHSDRSDIDLAIVAPKMSQEEYLALIEKVENELETLLKIDLIKWETAPSTLKEEIHKHSFTLFERPKKDEHQL
ncbi:nucleotidyltransferase domain-containing protein [Bacillus sp. FJAT-45037]|uniref:nucleotidyltransferase domain-containing protein n=1 Tax=Bacillus sp. FJAT-45037 TaxID=2011007 RepID=UPI000C241406|nr:nucleotidyltransferase domain-containing protein [Bacillus sp. FJAT-45037]